MPQIFIIHMRRLALLFAVSAWMGVVSGKDLPEKITYEDHVKPILRQHCLNCHHQGDKKGGLALDTFGSLIEGGGSGEVVYDDGDAESSRLWQLVNHDDTPVMPPGQDKLPADQLAVIRGWIEGGVLENSGSKAKKKKTNALAFVASTGGKPDGPSAMPESLPLETPLATPRAAAISALAASPWSPLVAVAGQKQIVLYHADTSELLGILPFPEGIPQDLAFSRDGAFLIVGGGEHSAHGLAVVYDVKTGERVAEVGDEFDTVFGADVNDSMSRLALGGPQKMLRIFDAQSGELLFDIKKHTDWIYDVAYSPDGVLVASADRSGGLFVWEAETGRLYLDLAGHKGAVHSISWRDDSNVLASASADGTVKLWEMVDGKTIKTINAHGGGVFAVKFDHQGRLATAGRDNRAKLWDASGKQLKSVATDGEDALEVAISHDGKRLIFGDWDGNVVNVATEEDAKVTLAANPAPAKQRAEQIRPTLVSFQKKLAPVKAELDEAVANVTKAKAPLAELIKKQASIDASIKQSQSEMEGLTQEATALDKQLPQISLATRDLQDALTAVRFQLKTDASKALSVAQAEETLASQLMDAAKKRRRRLELNSLVSDVQKSIVAKKAELEQLVQQRKQHEQTLESLNKIVDEKKKEHDELAARLSKVQSKLNRLLSEVN